MAAAMAPVERTTLHSETVEYRKVAKIFNKNSWVPNTGGMELEVLSIERVRNKMLEQRFLAKKQQYEQKYGQVRIVKGWHGTKQDNVDPILRNNFDVSKHGQNKGHRFGAGVSFSKLASYASHFSDKKTPTACMILADVLVSNVVEVPENKDRQAVLSEPPMLPGSSLRYDTTAKNKKRMDVFVKLEEDTFLPTHVVRFARTGGWRKEGQKGRQVPPAASASASASAARDSHSARPLLGLPSSPPAACRPAAWNEDHEDELALTRKKRQTIANPACSALRTRRHCDLFEYMAVLQSLPHYNPGITDDDVADYLEYFLTPDIPVDDDYFAYVYQALYVDSD